MDDRWDYRTSTPSRLPLQKLRKLLPGILDVPIVDDVVAVEDGPRLVPGDLHRHLLRDSGPDHIPNGRPPQIVEHQAIKTNLLAGVWPCRSKVDDRSAFTMGEPGAPWIKQFGLFHLRCKRLDHLPIDREPPALGMPLCVVKPDLPILQVDLVDPDLQDFRFRAPVW